MAEILCGSVARAPTGRKFHNGLWWVSLACESCGADSGGFVPEGTPCAYFCDERHNNCVARYSEACANALMPDEAFWRLIAAEQLEREGRILSPAEQIEALKDGAHYLSKLAKDRS